MSHILETRMADLGRQQDSLNQKIEQAIPKIESNRVTLKKVRYTANAAKSSADKLVQALAEIKKSLALLKNETNVLSQTTEKIAKQIKVIDYNLENMQTKLDQMDKNKAGRNEMERVFENYSKKTDKKLQALSVKVERQIKTMADGQSPGTTGAPAEDIIEKDLSE